MVKDCLSCSFSEKGTGTAKVHSFISGGRCNGAHHSSLDPYLDKLYDFVYVFLTF